MPNQPAPKSQQQSNAAGQGFSPYYQNQMQGPYFPSPMGMAPAQPGMGAYGQLGQNFFTAPIGPSYAPQSGLAFSGWGSPGSPMQAPSMQVMAGPSFGGYEWRHGPSQAPEQQGEFAAMQAPLVAKSSGVQSYTQTTDPYAAGPNFGALVGGAEGFGGQALAQADLEAWESLQPQMLMENPSGVYADLLNQQLADIAKSTRDAELKAAGVAAGAGIGTSTAFGSDITGVGLRGAEAGVQAQVQNQVALDQAMAGYQAANAAFENAKLQWEDHRQNLEGLVENAPAINMQFIRDYKDGAIDSLISEAGQFALGPGEGAWSANPALLSDIKKLSLKLEGAGVDSWAAANIIDQLILEYERQNLAFVQKNEDGTYNYMGYDEGGNVNKPKTWSNIGSGAKAAQIQW